MTASPFDGSPNGPGLGRGKPIKLVHPSLAWLLSKAAWFGLSWRFADREVDHGIGSGLADKSLKATKPLPTLALGDACFVFCGTGNRAIVTAVLGDVTRPADPGESP